MRDSETDYSANSESRERSLIAAIISQAITDACDYSSACDGVKLAGRSDARRWLAATYGPFQRDRQLFLHVLGIDIEVFDDRVAKLLAQSEPAYRALVAKEKVKSEARAAAIAENGRISAANARAAEARYRATRKAKKSQITTPIEPSQPALLAAKLLNCVAAIPAE